MTASTRSKIFIIVTFGLAFLSANYSYASSSQERFYKRINTIEKLMGDRQYNEALRRLDKLYGSYKNRKYEKSLILQLYGFVFSQKGETDQAIKSFNDCLALNTLPKSALQNLRLNISQLLLDKKQYSKAEKMFVSWSNSGQPLSPGGYALGGIIYAHQKKYIDAENSLQKAIKNSKQPKEDWFKLLLSIYIETKKYNKAKVLLTKMIVRYPDKKGYWLRLADVGYLLKEYTLASSVLEVAEKKGFLTQEAEYKKLAGFHYYSGVPFKSASTLETAFKKKILTPTIMLLKQQSYYYRQAKAYTEAIQSLQRAISLSPKPVLHYEIAQIYASQDEWKKASDTLVKMTDSNDQQLKNKAALLLGQSYFEQGKYSEALKIFDHLASEDETSHDAKQWKTYTKQVADLSN